eukprot:jgi/Chrzof1/4437/Cz14g13050.t1
MEGSEVDSAVGAAQYGMLQGTRCSLLQAPQKERNVDTMPPENKNKTKKSKTKKSKHKHKSHKNTNKTQKELAEV